MEYFATAASIKSEPLDNVKFCGRSAARPGAESGEARNTMMGLKEPNEYLPKFLKIRTKTGKLAPLRPKPAQQMVLDAIREERAAGRPPRLLVLKARQEGISTVTEGVMFHDAVTRKLVQTLIVAHRDDSTRKLFRMNQLFYDHLPRQLQPMRKHSNAQELVFENPTRDPGEKKRRPGLMSSIRCVTAGEGMGRSETLNNVHLSEFAFWRGDKNAILDGVMQAVPADPHTLVVIESTANGYNEFKDLWDGAAAGTNGWRPIFIAWWREPDYRMPVEPGTVWDQEELALMRTPFKTQRSGFGGERTSKGAERSLHEGRDEGSGLCEDVAYGLDEEQLAWRRWCIRVNFHGDVHAFRQEYPSTPDEAFLFSGTPFFDNEKLVLLRAGAPEPADVGTFAFPEPEAGGAPEDWAWASDRRAGFIKLYELPRPGAPYVIGGDTAGEGSDRFTAFVLDNTDGRQVAEMAFPFSELLYARQLYCLGRFYNTALIAVEVNFSTYPERKLEEWNYPKLYVRERFDTYTRKHVKAFGFQTTARTRPVILAGLHAVMEETAELVVGYDTLGEMLHFVYNEDRRPEAEEGEHDDLVMAAAICHFARDQQDRTEKPPEGRARTAWTDDMWEDYRNASAEVRKLLEKMWGRPK